MKLKNQLIKVLFLKEFVINAGSVLKHKGGTEIEQQYVFENDIVLRPSASIRIFQQTDEQGDNGTLRPISDAETDLYSEHLRWSTSGNRVSTVLLDNNQNVSLFCF